jgi:peptidyl-prolyl cis-trans isomerase NIMA-interacting 1
MTGTRIFLAVLIVLTAAVGYFWYERQPAAPPAPKNEPAEVISTAGGSSEEALPEAPPPDPRKLPGTPPAVAPEKIRVRGILIRYAGATGAEESRTKEEARSRAERIRDLARGEGVDFVSLVKYTDDVVGRRRKGELGVVKPGRLVKPLSDAAFALNVGEVSEVIETEYGFYVIQRTE